MLVEPDGDDPRESVALAQAIDDALDAADVRLPRLHHGYGKATWAVIRRAVEEGHDVRVGLEDTLELPDATPAKDNAELVRVALVLVHREEETG